MKKIINIICWSLVICTIISLIFTISTTYYFKYVIGFYGYFTFQCFMTATMITWSIKTYTWKESPHRIYYSVFCALIACTTVFFMFMKVY